MKKLLFFVFTVSLLFVLTLNEAEAQNMKNTSVKKSVLSTLNGGWERISVTVNGHKESSSQHPEFRVYHDGFFSIIGQDTTGAWKETHGGTYELTDNLYKEKILYSSFPDRMGLTHWQEYTIKGDTVTFKLFKKLITPNGEDMAAKMPEVEMICVRVKK
jgi:hypothetical protein